jgi:hypothetical protein
MSITEHPTEPLRNDITQSKVVPSALGKFDAATRKWYVHYSVVMFNLLSAAAGIAWFGWGIPQAFMSGQYHGLITGLILTIPTVMGVWIEGRQTYVGVLKGLAEFCRKGLPGLIARAADVLSEAAERADGPADK